MLETIKSLWIGDSLSKVEQLCIKSFLDHGHPFELYTYSSVKNVPQGTTLCNADEIIPESRIFTCSNGWGKGSYAGFADVFRFALLKARGGWWVDTDVICLKPFHLPAPLIICSSFEGEYGSCPNNCILKIPTHHVLSDYIQEEIARVPDLTQSSFGQLGPRLVQQAVRDLRLQSFVVPYYYFNPVSWANVGQLILGQSTFKEKMKETLRPVFKPATLPGRRIPEGAYALHLWNEVWRQSGFDKNKTYPGQSVFEKLKRKHGLS